ncbi:MAG: hypothetical protein QOE80_137 [Actinomycetota bacterium]|jgi:hypothetical protein|nr:hypothetical protein [Actinomycetota bacterium]
MHRRSTFRGVMAAAAAAAVFSVAVPADAAVTVSPTPGGGRQNSPDTTTITATCGNGLVSLGPIVIPTAPFTTTVIQCEAPSTTHQEVGR